MARSLHDTAFDRRDGELPVLERKGEHGTLTLYAAEGHVHLVGEHPEDESVLMSGADLHWLVTVAAPTLITALGGPIRARGIEPVGVPPRRAPEQKESK